MSKELIINASLPETRIAQMENGEIQELLVERASERGIVGNIYKGKVTRVLPGMQAAFVDIGLDKAAFLYVDDVHGHSDILEGSDDGETADSGSETPEASDGEIEASAGSETEPAGEGDPSFTDDEEYDLDDSEVSFLEDADSDVSFDEETPDEGELILTTDPQEESTDSETSAEDETAEDETTDETTEEETTDDSDEPTDEDDDKPVEMGQNPDDPEEGAAFVEKTDPPAESYSDPDDNIGNRVEAAPRRSSGSGDSSKDSRGGGRYDRSRSRGRRGRGGRGRGQSRGQRGGRGRSGHRPRSRNHENYPERFEAHVSDDGDMQTDRSVIENAGQGGTGDYRFKGRRRVRPELRQRRNNDRRVRSRTSLNPRRSQVSIEKLLTEGQEVFVQVAKDPIATKGARLTCHVSLPGRHLVCMPTIDHVGVSRRIERDDERRRLRMFVEKHRPEKMGFIVRTASGGDEAEMWIKEDIDYLSKLWNEIREKAAEVAAPALVYEDLNSVVRAIRDWVTEDITKIIIDSRYFHNEVKEFATRFMPELEEKIELYHGDIPIFDAYGISTELHRALERRVWLKSGGYIVVDQAEALLAIDVNTGRYVGKRNLEDTILKTNLEAVEEIGYQLRLRNSGGIIIIDLIDMEKEENRRRVYRALEQALRKDRARPTIIKMSELGLIVMTRKRTRDTLVRALCQPCAHCEGKGFLKSKQTVAYDILRELEREGIERDIKRVLVQAHPDVIDILAIDERDTLASLEKRYRKQIYLQAVGDFILSSLKFQVIDRIRSVQLRPRNRIEDVPEAILGSASREIEAGMKTGLHGVLSPLIGTLRKSLNQQMLQQLRQLKAPMSNQGTQFKIPIQNKLQPHLELHRVRWTWMRKIDLPTSVRRLLKMPLLLAMMRAEVPARARLIRKEKQPVAEAEQAQEQVAEGAVGVIHEVGVRTAVDLKNPQGVETTVVAEALVIAGGGRVAEVVRALQEEKSGGRMDASDSSFGNGYPDYIL